MSAGIPEAFLGRLDDLLLSKPLLKTEVYQITEKFLTNQKAVYKDHYNVEIVYDQAFVERLSDLFFTHATGARSVRSFVENRLEAYVVKPLLEADRLKKGSPTKIVLELEGDIPKTSFVDEGFEPNFKIRVTMKVPSKKDVVYEKDITERVPAQRFLTKDEAKLVAYHEAGHAIINDENVSGQSVEYITISPTSGALGYVRFLPNDKPVTRAAIINRVAALFAGTMSQQRAGFPADSGWSSDREKILNLTSQAILEMGLEPGFMGTTLKNLSQAQKRKFEKLQAQMIEEGHEQANVLFNARWPIIEAAVQKLLVNPTIVRSEFLALTGQEQKPKVKGKGKGENCGFSLALVSR
jgi:hypothetical protein